ncbi:MAG: hypothetical protein WKG06_36970 [Segetibacter sp.]
MAKAGLTKVIKHLYFYLHLCLISADGFQMPCLRQAVNRCLQPFWTHQNNHSKTLMARIKLNSSLPTFDELLIPTIQALQQLGGSGSIEEINGKGLRDSSNS